MLRRTNNLGMTRREEKRVGKEIRTQTSKALAERDMAKPLTKHTKGKDSRR